MRQWLWAVLVGIAILVFPGCKKQELPETSALAPPTPAAEVATAPTAEATASPGEAEAKAISYVCPDCGAKSDKPGECETCKKLMKADVPEGTEVEYYCPMHPEMTQSEPGKCEECKGMPLMARLKEAKAEPAVGDTAPEQPTDSEEKTEPY